MLDLKNKYIGKQLTWNETVDLFPDLWVAFKDCEFDKVTFIKGTLVEVMEDKDRIAYTNEHWEDGLYIDRTTEESGENYLHGVLVEKKY